MTAGLPRRRAGPFRRALRAWLLAATAFAVPGLAPAAEKMLLGVQTHFGYGRSDSHARQVEWLKAARIDSTRDEMFWNFIEDQDGTYAFRQGAQFVRQTWWNELPAVAPLLTLGFGNPRYDGAGQPQSPEAVAAYADYARWVVGQTRSRIRTVEIWNEWNLKAGAVLLRGARGGAKDYVRMAKATTQAIRSVDPGVQVLVGGTGDDYPDWQWMREAMDEGLLDSVDGVSVHFYNHCNRAELGADEMLRRADRLQALMRQKAGKEVPVHVTEFGWPVHNGKCGVGEADAGVFTLRFLLEASTRPWIKGVWVYETIDSGTDASNQEHRFGLLRRDGSERPSGCVMREFGAIVASRPAQVIRQGGVTAAVYHEAGRSLVFAWGREADRGARGLRISASAAGTAATASAAMPTPTPAPVACQLPGGTVTASGGRLQLQARLDSARPAVFVLPQTWTLDGVQLD